MARRFFVPFINKWLDRNVVLEKGERSLKPVKWSNWWIYLWNFISAV